MTDSHLGDQRREGRLAATFQQRLHSGGQPPPGLVGINNVWALSMGQTWGLLGPIQVDSSEEKRIQQDAAGGLTKLLEAGERVGHQAAWRCFSPCKSKKKLLMRTALEVLLVNPTVSGTSSKLGPSVSSGLDSLVEGTQEAGGTRYRVFAKCRPRLEKVDSNSRASMENPGHQLHSITTKPFCQKH